MDVKLTNIAGGIPAPATKKSSPLDAGAAAATVSKPSEGESAAKPDLRVSELTAKLMAEPQVDSERVNRVASQIQAGGYQIDPQRAANNMIRMEMSFR